MVVYDQNSRPYDTAVGAHHCRWKALGRICDVMFIEFGYLDMSLVRHNDGVEYKHGLGNWFQRDTNNGMLDLSCCCPEAPESYYLLQDAGLSRS